MTVLPHLKHLTLPLNPELAAIAIERRFEPHQDLFLEGDLPREIFAIVHGRVKLWRAEPQGPGCTLLMLGKGEIVGSVAVAQNLPHLISATALDSVVAVSWPAPFFRQNLRRDADLASGFLEAVARRASQLIDRLDDTAGLGVEERLARLLVRLAGDFGRHDDALAIVIDVRQQDLAEMAYTTVPTVSRILSEWKREDIVSATRGHLTIHHLSGVANVAGIHLD